MAVAVKSNSLPMTGTLTRESKKPNEHKLHKYVLVLKFAASKRWYADEVIFAKDKRAAIKHARLYFPNAKVE